MGHFIRYQIEYEFTKKSKFEQIKTKRSVEKLRNKFRDLLVFNTEDGEHNLFKIYCSLINYFNF